MDNEEEWILLTLRFQISPSTCISLFKFLYAKFILSTHTSHVIHDQAKLLNHLFKSRSLDINLFIYNRIIETAKSTSTGIWYLVSFFDHSLYYKASASLITTLYYKAGVPIGENEEHLQDGQPISCVLVDRSHDLFLAPIRAI